MRGTGIFWAWRYGSKYGNSPPWALSVRKFQLLTEKYREHDKQVMLYEVSTQAIYITRNRRDVEATAMNTHWPWTCKAAERFIFYMGRWVYVARARAVAHRQTGEPRWLVPRRWKNANDYWISPVPCRESQNLSDEACIDKLHTTESANTSSHEPRHTHWTHQLSPTRVCCLYYGDFRLRFWRKL